jgi:hypothetical protein
MEKECDFLHGELHSSFECGGVDFVGFADGRGSAADFQNKLIEREFAKHFVVVENHFHLSFGLLFVF